MANFNAKFVDYKDTVALVLSEYKDTNDNGTLFNLYVFSNPPQVLNGVTDNELDTYGKLPEPEPEPEPTPKIVNPVDNKGKS